MNRWAPFVVAALAFTGCSNDPAIDSADAHGWVAAEIRGTLTQSDRDRLDKAVFGAEQAAVGRCMELAGFDYSPVGYTDANSGSAFSLTDPADVATYGFGISTDPFPALSIVDDPNADALGMMSDSEASAWYSAFDECAASSRDTAYEQLGVAELMSVLGDASELTTTDDRVKRARIEWSACAADLGVMAESLDAVVAKLNEEARSIPPEALASAQDRERRLATDLLPCTQAFYAVQQSVFADVATSLATDRGLDVDADRTAGS